jgi:hypothetical protein
LEQFWRCLSARGGGRMLGRVNEWN